MQIHLDNVKSKLSANGLLLQDLQDYLSIEASFWQRKNVRGWDGIKRFVTPKGQFLTGLLPLIVKFVENEYPDEEIVIEDDRGPSPRFSDTFSPRVGKYLMEDKYVHQRDALERINRSVAGVPFYRGIIDAATNAGKTTIAGGLFLNLEGDVRMLLTIHTKTVFRQLVEELSQIFDKVGMINDKTYDIQPVTVAMIQTLYSRIAKVKKDLQQFNTLVVDECHRAGSATYTKVLAKVPAPIRVGLSGTAYDSSNQVSILNATGHLSNRVYNISKRMLMDKGISTETEVHIHLNNTMLTKLVIDYRDIQRECIYNSIERSALIMKHAGEVTLIAVEKIEHGQAIYDNLMSMATGKAIEFTHGKDKGQEEKIAAFKAGEIDILISTAILKEGVSLPLVDNTWWAAGGLSGINIKQWMGRAERLLKGKDKVIFHDFYDIGAHIKGHSETRIKLYKKEGLKVVEHYDPEKVKQLKLKYVG